MSRRKLQRQKLVDLVSREIRRDAKREGKLVEQLLGESLIALDDATDDAGAAIALLPFMPDRSLEAVALEAVVHREQLKGASEDQSHEKARGALEPLGVRYGECGCLSWIAGKSCCDRGVELAKSAAESRAAREQAVVAQLQELQVTNPAEFKRLLALLGRLVGKSQRAAAK